MKLRKYTFIGEIIPSTVRGNTPQFFRNVEAGPDYPAGRIDTQIIDSKIISRFTTEDTLTESAVATVKQIVENHASQLSEAGSVLQGAWCIPKVGVCIYPGSRVANFKSNNENVREVFAELKISLADFKEVYGHDEGYYLAHVISDFNSALKNGQYMRFHGYRAIEAMMHSVNRVKAGLSRAEKWESFRESLGIPKEKINLFAHHPERHGAYDDAQQLSAADVKILERSFAEMIAAYIKWFKCTRIKQKP